MSGNARGNPRREATLDLVVLSVAREDRVGAVVYENLVSARSEAIDVPWSTIFGIEEAILAGAAAHDVVSRAPVQLVITASTLQHGTVAHAVRDLQAIVPCPAAGLSDSSPGDTQAVAPRASVQHSCPLELVITWSAGNPPDEAFDVGGVRLVA
jgi:hypothetical protein